MTKKSRATKSNPITMLKRTIRESIPLLLQYESVDQVLNTCKTQSEKGFMYERLWDICIKFGTCDIFQGSQIHHIVGNVNTGAISQMKSFNSYLSEKMWSGNTGGCSDITLCDTDTYIFMSSKYPKTKDDLTKQKSVDYYDVQKIVSMVDDNKHIYKSFKIYLLVPDKKTVLDKVKSANISSNYITKYMNEDQILDKHDLNLCFLRWKADMKSYIIQYTSLENIPYDEIYLAGKLSLSLRFHQEYITDKTSALIEKGNKSFLWGCKCRSGKTYMSGGLVLKEFHRKSKLNVLVITPAPTETIPQFTDDLFNAFKEFKPFSIHHIESSAVISTLPQIDLAENNIFIMSKQLLQQYIGDATIKEIRALNLDIIIFDENHFAGTTELSKGIIESYATANTVKVYLTATYNKPLREWNIPEECQMYWDIEDEQICKSILQDNNLDRLVDKHGDSVYRTISHFTEMGLDIHDIFAPYKEMPDLHLMTTLFDRDRYETIKQKIMGTKYGFCFDVLFALNKQKTRFEYETEVATILRYISGSNKEVDFKNQNTSMLYRIKKVCSDNESRVPFTQIWFLPSDSINEISSCLKTLMEADGVLKKYAILCINSKNKDLAKDIKHEITKAEIIAKAEGKDGLILLAGNMLTLGITLALCDIVVLMNNTLSSDKVMQQMFRCMTEASGKRFGFVVDMNISRVLHTCINYSVYKNDMNAEEKLKYLIENHLINIDTDMMIQKRVNSDNLVGKLMDIWKSDPVNSFKSLLRNLDNDYVEFDTSVQKLINTSFANSIKDKLDITVEVNEGETQDLPSGKEVTQESNTKETDEKEDIEPKISFTKDVLPYVIPLVCILTIKNKNKDFVKMLNDIQENSNLLEIFDDMCLIWWNKKNLIHIIKNVVEKYFDKNSNTYNISIQFKMSLHSLIDHPKELFEVIMECLKPKSVEKRKYGEVFTPLKFINENMLVNLEKHYQASHGKNIYEDETLTWGDTTAGMGNFPIALYYKLMNGLDKKIPDVNLRKKHILEKMIYMAELNKKNCFIIKQIFNIHNDYNLNLYEGDSLSLDIQKEFGVSSLDIIIGNPPYNEELTSVGAKPLYNKFVEYYIDKCKILTYVIPSRWFSGGKGLDSFRHSMLQRTDIAYIHHFDDEKTIFGPHVSIEGGVNYFLKDSSYNDKCVFNGSKTQLNKYDVFVDSKYYTIIDKVKDLPSITQFYKSQDYHKIQTNDKRFRDTKTDDTIKCYVSKQKGFEKYIPRNEIKTNIGKYKVLTPDGNGGNKCFGHTFIGYPNEVHSKTYISFELDTEDQAKSLLSFMQSRLANFLLALRKNSQHTSASTCKWIPLPSLDKIWTNDMIYEHFKLSDDDIQLIKSTHIQGYKE